MVFDLSKVTGIGKYTEKHDQDKDDQPRTLYFKDDKAFLVINKNTIEIRTDAKLGNLLREKYESVMESRYFGRGGIEIVLADQLKEDELYDLVRLSYNLS